MCLRMRVGQKSVERGERILSYGNFAARDLGLGRNRSGILRAEYPGEKSVRNHRQSEPRQPRIVRMRYPNRENVRIAEEPADTRGKFRMEVGNEEDGGFGADFFRNFAHGNAVGRKGRERSGIFTERRGETADVGVRKRGLQYPDTVSGIRDGSGTVARSYGASGDEFKNRHRRIETRLSGLSETHGSGNVDDAPDRNFPIGNEGLHERLAATETGLPVYRTGVVSFGIRAESAEFHPLAGKHRSVLTRGKRRRVAEFGEVEKTHVGNWV